MLRERRQIAVSRLAAILGLTLLLAVVLVACGRSPTYSPRDAADANDTGATFSAKSDAERTLLAQAASLRAGAHQVIGGSVVTAEPPYTAASGRICRAFHLKTAQTATHRLACSEGGAWFFVPDVFSPAAAAALEQR